MFKLYIFVFLICSSCLAQGIPSGWPSRVPGRPGGVDCDKIETQVGDGGIDNSDPIVLGTGEFQNLQTDLSIPGRGFDFKIQRLYRSISGLASAYNIPHIDESNLVPFGADWGYEYNMRIAFDIGVDLGPIEGGLVEGVPVELGQKYPLTIKFVNGSNRLDKFMLYTASENDIANGLTQGYSNPQFDLRIDYRYKELEVKVVLPSQKTYVFYGYQNLLGDIAPYGGRLKYVIDRNGNQIQFFYETSSGIERIDYAIDTLGNRIEYYYHDQQFNGQQSDFIETTGSYAKENLIWYIEDHTGRAWEYNYSAGASSKLLSVRSPEIVNDNNDYLLPVEHERFLDGTEWVYEYGSSDGILKSIQNPNGELVVENEYNTIHGGANYHRVLRQKYKDNSYYNYIVTTTSGLIFENHLAFNDEFYVWVNDRRGAITRFKYSGYDELSGVHFGQLLEKVEFSGFVSMPNKSVWATEDSNEYTWYYLDESTGLGIGFDGPKLADGTFGEVFTYDWTPDTHWNMTSATGPELSGTQGARDKVTRYFDTGVNAPLQWSTLLSVDTYSAKTGETISESWDYSGFDFGGGCGCGSQGFETGYRDGKGYVTYKVYDDSINPNTGKVKGDLLAVYTDLPPQSSMNPGATYAENNAASIDKYEYNDYGQVVKHTHPEKMILDESGAPVPHNRVDQYVYYPTNTQGYGRLHEVHIDATTPQSQGGDLTTVYSYDAIGNITKVIEPDGDVSVNLYNQASQRVRSQQYDKDPDAHQSAELYSQVDYFYDANGNIVREEVLNLDGDLAAASNTTITTVLEYDLHDFLVGTSTEAGAFDGTIQDSLSGGGRYDLPTTNDLFVSQEWVYDAADNLIEFRNGESVNGINYQQSSNTIKYEYDARDLRLKKTIGEGSTSPLVTEYEYDVNERLSRIIINSTSVSQQQSTLLSYDGFDRLIERVDPMLNKYQYEFDDNHNLVSIKVLGQVDEDTNGSSGNVVLAEVSRTYGVLDLLESQSVETFDYNYISENPNAASAPRITFFVYNQDSSVRTITSPSGNSTPFEQNLYYDTVSRIEFQEDIAGNITQYEYDVDSNITKMMQTDISSLDSSVELFEAIYEYDALDRRVAVVDGVGNRTDTKYDSRSNILQQEDARTNINAYTYDSMSRLLTTSLGNGTVTAAKEYDASNRLVSETDANGNETEYEYDGLNRVTKITMPDGEFYQAQYDANGNMSQYIDARGVVVIQGFDLNNRLTHRDITGTSIPGTTTEDYTYDGLGRLRKAKNDFSKITREYDSRSNIVRELQNIDVTGNFPAASDREVAYEFDLANNTTKLSYPGGRDVYRTFDELNRLAGIFNDDLFADPITEFEYIGRRLQRREHGNGTRTDYIYNGIEDGLGGVTNKAGDFGFGRVAEISTTKVSSSTVLDEFAFAWDKTQNRTVYNDTGSGMKNQRERAFGYDAANRLVSTDVDFPNPLTDFTSPTNNGITTYTLDGVYNRTNVSGFESNGAPIGTYSQTGDQAKNNQYTITPRAEGGEWMNFHDKNGNLIEKYQITIADFNGDHAVNFFDVSAFLAAFNLEDASADLNGDGVWNFFDVNEFLGANSALDGTALEQWYYTYDFRNQLIEAKQVFGVSDVTLVTTNTYDPAARRVIESVDVDGDGTDDTARHLIYGCASLWEVIEQIDIATDTTMMTHVYGLGIDDEVSYQYTEQSMPKDIWTHRDDLNSLTNITDSNGDVKERYEYGDFGKVAFFDEAGVSLPSSSFNAQHLYTGRSMIAGTGLYDYRFRVMQPETGGFNQRDPLGHHDSMNMYGYVISSPYSYIDPLGMSYEGAMYAFNWLLTGYVNPTPAMLEAGFEGYSLTVNDRINGIGDGLGIDSLASNLGGTDYTFDPNQRAKGECWANCVKTKLEDAAYDAIADGLTGPIVAPFLNIDSDGNIDIQPPDLLSGIQGVSYGTGGGIGVAGLTSQAIGTLMDKTNIGRQRGRHIRQGGRRFRRAAKTIKTPGHIASAIKAYIIMRDCAKKCDDCPDAY